MLEEFFSILEGAGPWPKGTNGSTSAEQALLFLQWSLTLNENEHHSLKFGELFDMSFDHVRRVQHDAADEQRVLTRKIN
jgi:hypothetical protein